MLQVLQVADSEFPGSQSTPLMMARLGIAHSRALARHDISAAQRFGSMMSALCHPSDSVMLEQRCVNRLLDSFFWRQLSICGIGYLRDFPD